MSEVLLVDATEELQPLADELARAGFRVASCTAEEVPDRLRSGEPLDALLINLMNRPADAAVGGLLHADVLPPNTATIAIVSASDLAGLEYELPVDDLLVYPAPQEELAARIRRAAWRRTGAESAHVLRSGELLIDQGNYKVFLGGRPVQVTYKEYELLRFLVLNQGKVCTREMLLNQVWGYDFYGGARTVDVHIRRLRSKIENHTQTFIQTVRNVGYRFQAG